MGQTIKLKRPLTDQEMVNTAVDIMQNLNCNLRADDFYHDDSWDMHDVRVWYRKYPDTDVEAVRNSLLETFDTDIYDHIWLLTPDNALAIYKDYIYMCGKTNDDAPEPEFAQAAFSFFPEGSI